MKHQHPIKILKLTTKNFWLLLIPLLRGLIALQGDLYTWVRGAWLDILVILFIGGIAYLRWYFTWFEITDKAINVQAGVLAKSVFSVPFSSVCAVSSEKKFYLKPIRAVNLYLDTNSGTFRSADIQLTVRLKDSRVLFKTIMKENALGYKASYSPSRFNLTIFSFLFSSTLSGVVFIVTFLLESSKIIGNSLEQRLMTAVNDVSNLLATGLPPLTIGISLLIAVGWLFSFINNLLRHIGFKIERINKIINIRTGFFTKRHYYINAEKINYADLRQNTLMMLFSVMSVHVNCSGYGKVKNEIPVFVPMTTSKQVYSSLQLLLPSISVIPGGVKPKKSYFFRFIWAPLVGILVITALALIAYRIFPSWYSMILFMAIMIEIPAIWLLIAKFVHFATTRIAFSENKLCLKYSFGYAFHTILLPMDKIAKITIKQSFFQTFANSCDIKIYSNNEFTQYHRVICMPLNDVLELLKTSGLCDSQLNFFAK